jgi:hypothetical protein
LAFLRKIETKPKLTILTKTEPNVIIKTLTAPLSTVTALMEAFKQAACHCCFIFLRYMFYILAEFFFSIFQLRANWLYDQNGFIKCLPSTSFTWTTFVEKFHIKTDMSETPVSRRKWTPDSYNTWFWMGQLLCSQKH